MFFSLYNSNSHLQDVILDTDRGSIPFFVLQLIQSFNINLFRCSAVGQGEGIATLPLPIPVHQGGYPLEFPTLLRPRFARGYGGQARRFAVPAMPDTSSAALIGHYRSSSRAFGAPSISRCIVALSDGLAELGPGRHLMRPARSEPARANGGPSRPDARRSDSGFPKGSSLWCPEHARRWGQAHLLAPVWEDREILYKKYCAICINELWKKK